MFRRVRQWHRRLAWIAALPAAIIITTGMFLHLRRVVPWIQPPAQKSSLNGSPSVGPSEAFQKIVASEQIKAESQIESWDDIKSVEYKPSSGTWSFKSQNYYEVQIDGQTGQVLSAAPRRSLWLMQLHEGALLGSSAMWLVFFPTGILLFVLEFTGVYLLLDSRFRKRRKHGTS